MTPQKKAPNGSFSTRSALSCASNFLPSRIFQQFPPIRSPKIVKLICRFNYPSPARLEELHANRIAFAVDWLAVGHPSCGAKLSRARGKHQPRILVPAPDADHACTFRADIFRKRSFRAGKLAITFQNHGNFHLDPEFPAGMGVDVSMCHRSSISEARSDACNGIHGAAAVFHAIKRVVRGAQELFRSVPVLG